MTWHQKSNSRMGLAVEFQNNLERAFGLNCSFATTKELFHTYGRKELKLNGAYEGRRQVLMRANRATLTTRASTFFYVSYDHRFLVHVSRGSLFSPLLTEQPDRHSMCCRSVHDRNQNDGSRYRIRQYHRSWYETAGTIPKPL